MIEEFLTKARKVRLLLMDCDGVLTDGRLYFSESGEIMKAFHVRDGQGIVLWHKAGFLSAIISGRSSEIVRVRANELGIKMLFQGVDKKLKVIERISAESKIGFDEMAFIGDDIGDVDAMKAVGFSACVADAVRQVKSVADFVTTKNGGEGAVREVIDFLLHAKGISYGEIKDS